MAEKLRVGVIGCGRWSKKAHIPGWVRSPKKQRIKPYGVVPVYVRDPDYVPDTDEAEEVEEFGD